MFRESLTPFVLLMACSAIRPQSAPETKFRPGHVWRDTLGKPIQAHGGGILGRNGIYYWYGEDKTLGNFNRTGVSCYSSRDLLNWRHEGVVLAKDAMPEQFRDQAVCERPKVIFNRATNQFVMWMHLDDRQYHVASAGIAVAGSPTGPFRFLHYIRPIKHNFGPPPEDPNRQEELGGTFRDMKLFLDDDGRAYAFYASENNATMYVCRLNREFTGPETPQVEGKTWARILVGQMREAPAPFKHRGKYFLITSGCTGWNPNAAN